MRNLIPLAVILAFTQASLGQSATSKPATSRPVEPKHEAPLIEEHLNRGELARAESLVAKSLAADPDNDNLRFQLGTVQVLRGVERFIQSMYANGFKDQNFIFSMYRMPTGQNPDPRTVSYDDVRRIFQVLVDDLLKADATLAPIRSDKVLLPLHPGLIRMDLNGDGKAEPDETMWSVFERYAGFGITARDADEFMICFDFADVVWLRGYSHLLAGLGEIVLAHDFHELFDRVGHILFAKPKTSHANLEINTQLWAWGNTDIADLIAMIHLINFPVSEPDRLKAAHAHLKMTVQLSRDTWDRILKETDDDHEWIPCPGTQRSVISGLRLTKEQLDSWRQFLDYLDALLDGKALLPHWRFPNDMGVNLRRVFFEPRPFDLVLWVQGSAATPYMEKGKVLNRAVWQQLDRAFHGGFLSFSVWFN